MFNNGFNVSDNLKTLTVEQLKERSENDRLPFAILLLNLEHDLNIGNCIRTAHLLGAERVIILGNSKVDTRACVGSQNYTNVVKRKILEHEDLIEVFWGLMSSYNYCPWIIEKNNFSMSIEKMNFYYESQKKYCLVFGNENKGIPVEFEQENVDFFHIEQRGVLRSLNVSSACAIATYEFTKLF
jgi:23S rRNA (guanosine2251-2'-O)-methyltransferase